MIYSWGNPLLPISSTAGYKCDLLFERSNSLYVFWLITLVIPVMNFDLANYSLGFQDVVTIDMLREAYPLLDVVDHNRRPKDSVSSINIESSSCFTDESDIL